MHDEVYTKIKIDLFVRAAEMYDQIEPCFNKTFKDCYTIHNDKVIFWFNTKDNSTKTMIGNVDSFSE